MGLSQKVLERLFANEKRAERVAQAIAAAQRGKMQFDPKQGAVMHQISFATKDDYKQTGKRLRLLRRRVQALASKVPGLYGKVVMLWALTLQTTHGFELTFEGHIAQR